MLPSERITRFIELSLRLNILISVEPEIYRFGHLILRDYFAYKYAVRHLRDRNLYGDFFNTPAMCLAELKDPRSVDLLIDLLNNGKEDGAIRGNAACALGRLEDKKAIEPLLLALFDDEFEVQSGAVYAFAFLKTPRAVKPLTYLLYDAKLHESKNYSPARVLGILQDRRAVQPLIDALYYEGREDGHYEMREYAAMALGQLGDLRAVEPLIEVLAADDLTSPSAAADALGQLKDLRAVEPLITALDHGGYDWYLPGAAASALGDLGDQRAVKALIKALATYKGHPNHYGYTCTLIVSALVDLASPEAVEPIISCLDTGYELRGVCIAALGRLRDPRAVEPLIPLLADTETNEVGRFPICDEVAKTLLLIGTTKAKNAVKDWQMSKKIEG